MKYILKSIFGVRESNSTFRREAIAGVTTFMAMAYIVFVNPAILANAVRTPGVPETEMFKALACATCLASAVGIGIFIAFIGLKHAGIIVINSNTFVQLGNLTARPVLVTMAGMFITSVLYVRKIRGAILLGIVATGLIAWQAGLIQPRQTWFELPSLSPVFGKLDIRGTLHLAYLGPIFVLLFFHLFDSVGTLIGLGEQAGFMKNGKLPRATRALFSDAAASTLGAVIGTSTVTPYIESAAGIADGGRTGLANIVTGLLFIAAMFFAPLAEMFGAGLNQTFTIIINGQPIAFQDRLYPVTAPALIVVGCLMMQSVREINWPDWTEAMPAFLTIILMPLTFSISTGLFAGMVAYPLLKIVAGRAREVHWLMYVLVVVFVAALVALIV